METPRGSPGRLTGVRSDGRGQAFPGVCEPVARTLLLWFAIAGFLLWELTFGYHRFLIPLELLSGIVLVALLDHVFSRTPRALAAFALLALLIVSTVRVPSWGRKPWGDTWFGVHLPEQVPDDTLVLMVGDAPSAYVIPFFPPRPRFVRLQADLLPLARDAQLGRDIAATVATHRGALRVLLGGRLDAAATQALAAHGVRTLPATCRRIESRFDDKLSLCAAERIAGT